MIKIREKEEQLERAVCQKTVEYVLREDRIGYIAERVVEQYEKEFDASIIKEKKEMSLVKLDAELDKCAESLMHTTVRSVVDRINARAKELKLLSLNWNTNWRNCVLPVRRASQSMKL